VPLNEQYASTGTIATTLPLRHPIVTLTQGKLSPIGGLKVIVLTSSLWNG
jgi:hypothetical protein